ncbi:MAG: type II secretion system protein GspK [Terricaulis sp.]
MMEALIVVTLTALIALMLLPLATRGSRDAVSISNRELNIAAAQRGETGFRELLAAASQPRVANGAPPTLVGNPVGLVVNVSMEGRSACADAGVETRVSLRIVPRGRGGALVCGNGSDRDATLFTWDQGLAAFSYGEDGAWSASAMMAAGGGMHRAALVRFTLQAADLPRLNWVAMAGWTQPARVAPDAGAGVQQQDFSGDAMNKRAGSEGYVLFLVAVIVAVLSLLALMATRVQSQMSSPIRNLREQAQLELAAQSAAARLSFLLATQPLGERSILVGADADQQTTPDATMPAVSASGQRIVQLLLDGSSYVWRAPGGNASYLITIQDEAGLLDFNGGDEVGAANLLREFGLSNGAANSLGASLADYVDQDDLRRRGGAERSDYIRAGLPPPPNGPLNSVQNALNAFGWRETLPPSLRQQVFADSAARTSSAGLNVNTAPLPVLVAAYNLNERAAQSIVNRRRASPFRAADEVRAFTGETPRAEAPQPTTMPGNAFRIVVQPLGQAAQSGYAYELEVTFGGGQSDRPVYGRSGWLRRNTLGSSEEGDGEARAFPDTPAIAAP